MFGFSVRVLRLLRLLTEKIIVFTIPFALNLSKIRNFIRHRLKNGKGK